MVAALYVPQNTLCIDCQYFKYYIKTNKENFWKMWAKSAPLPLMRVRGLSYLIHKPLQSLQPRFVAMPFFPFAVHFLIDMLYRWQSYISRREPDIITIHYQLHTAIGECANLNRKIFNRSPQKATEQMYEHSGFEKEQQVIFIHTIMQAHTPVGKPVPLRF